MQNHRRHERFRLDLMDVDGRMILAHKVEIIDISLGGVALKTDRRLNVGNEYLIKLGSKGKNIDVKGTIMRCELSSIETQSDGEGVSIYTAGMMFKNIPPNYISDFINSIEQDKREARLVSDDRRLHVRFFITAPGEQTLNFPAHFRVKIISLGGMLIQTDRALGINSMIPMGLSLQEADKTVEFIGRVASCLKTVEQEHTSFEIGVEFKDLTDKDRALLKTFIDYLSLVEGNKDAKKTGN